MIIAVGIDMVEIARVERLLASKGDHALRKLFTDAERTYAQSKPRPALHFAARVAAKEATYKALRGTHQARAIGWRELEVTLEWDGAPTLLLHGGAERRAVELGVTRVHLSLTHTASSAAAVAVLEGPGTPPETENYSSSGAQK
ncbi:MAG: holo-ACP synthase [Gemmatimonadota bacterium]|nr:holo-ACP synthase [Gemmatimonadota bacterium]